MYLKVEYDASCLESVDDDTRRHIVKQAAAAAHGEPDGQRVKGNHQKLVLKLDKRLWFHMKVKSSSLDVSVLENYTSSALGVISSHSDVKEAAAAKNSRAWIKVRGEV